MFASGPLYFRFERDHLREVWLVESNIASVDVILPAFVLSHSDRLATVTAHLSNFIISQSPRHTVKVQLKLEFEMHYLQITLNRLMNKEISCQICNDLLTGQFLCLPIL